MNYSAFRIINSISMAVKLFRTINISELGDALAWQNAEHKLHWTTLHTEYKNIFESRAQKILVDNGFDVSCVLDQLNKFTKGIM